MVNENKKDSVKSLFYGFFSGLMSVTVTQPLQVIRTNMMIKYYDKKPMGFFRTIRNTYNLEGIGGFYRSIYPTLLRSPLNSGLFFSSLEFFKNTLSAFKNLNQHTINSISSACARAFTCTAINPLLIVITRLEIVGFKEYSSTFNGIKKIYIEEGFRGYFQGLKVLLIKEIPSAAIFYPLYEFTKGIIKKMGYSTAVQASSSAFLVNFFLASLNNPLDVIRTRLQYLYYSNNKDHNYKGIFSSLKMIMQKEGIRGLTVGIIPRVIKRTLGSSISWTIYEVLQENSEKSKNINHPHKKSSTSQH